MNDKYQELFNRLKKATDIIWRNPRTSAEVIMIFEEFVSSLEQIAADLSIVPDRQIAKNLDEIIRSHSV